MAVSVDNYRRKYVMEYDLLEHDPTLYRIRFYRNIPGDCDIGTYWHLMPFWMVRNWTMEELSRLYVNILADHRRPSIAEIVGPDGQAIVSFHIMGNMRIYEKRRLARVTCDASRDD